jgi:polyisoprenyl-phosphate glycosyltransferase
MAKLGIIIPVYNEAYLVETLVERVGRVLDGLAYATELFLVDDGSTDGTAEKLLELQDAEPRLTVLRLSRNWGHQNAYNAGLEAARDCDAVVLLDGDLEDPPELIGKLVAEWEKGNDIVYTVKEHRVESWWRRQLFRLYYRTMRMAGVKLTPQSGMYSLIGTRPLRYLREFRERNKSYPNLRSFIGFRQAAVRYRRDARLAGKPKQSVRALFRDGANALFGFSTLPIHMMTVVGLVLSLFFVALALFVLFLRMTGIEFWIFRQVPGWTSATLISLLVSTTNLLFLGLLGQYIARIYDEVRERPYYIIDQVFPSRAGAGAAQPSAAQQLAESAPVARPAARIEVP